MGAHYLFQCSECKYNATVSGGRDVGMLAVTKTMICQSCNEVVDVMIGQFGQDGPTGDPEFDKELGICPGCEGADLRSWSRRHPCPKCNGRMIREKEPRIMWD